MDSTLNNQASAVGEYNNISTSLTSEVSVVTMIDGLTITKSADKKNWASGVLTYTIVVNNTTANTYSGVNVTDILDTTKVKLVDGSVTVDGNIIQKGTNVNEYTYDDTNGTLVVNLGDIATTVKKTITFQISKV